MRVPLLLALVVLLAAALADAQTAINTTSGRTQATVGKDTIVRDSSGNLYFAYYQQFSPPQYDIAVARSTDGGQTWNLTWQSGFAGNGTGDRGNLQPCLVIDGKQNLHVSWYHETSSQYTRTIRYNRYDAGSKAWGAEVAITPSGDRTHVYSALAVDSQNYVWFIHSTTGWRCRLSRSDQQYAANQSFSLVSPTFSTVGSCQNPNLVIDANDIVHVSYYSTANGATVHHQWMDPNATTPAWSAETPLGNQNAQADYYSAMEADLKGDVYIVYGVDVQRQKTADPEWFVRKWDGTTQSWGTPVSVYKTLRSQYDPGTPGNDGRVITAACDEVSSEFYFVYRDYDAGNLLLGRWRDGEASATVYATLMSTGTLPPNAVNYFFAPQLRGSLFPSFNRATAGLDLLYTTGDQKAPTPSYKLWWDPFPLGSLASTGTPKIGTTYALDLLAVQDPSMSYAVALSITGAVPGIPFDRRFLPLVPDTIFSVTAANLLPAIFQNFQATLSGSGTGQARIAIPALGALVGIKFWGAFITYPGGPSGVKTISNSWTFTIIS